MATGSAFARAALAGNPSDGHGGAVLAVCVPGLAAHAEAHAGARDAQRSAERAGRRRRGALRARPVRGALGHQRPARGRPRRLERDRHGGSARPVRPARRRPRARRSGRDGARGRGRGSRHRRRAAGPLRPGPRGARAHGLRGRPPAGRALGSRAPARPLPRLARRRGRGLPRRARRPARTRGRARPARRHGAAGGHARAARDALLSGDRAAFAEAVDASFDERAALLDLDPRHVAMVRAARATGASANYAGLRRGYRRYPAVSRPRARRARIARAGLRDHRAESDADD